MRDQDIEYKRAIRLSWYLEQLQISSRSTTPDVKELMEQKQERRSEMKWTEGRRWNTSTMQSSIQIWDKELKWEWSHQSSMSMVHWRNDVAWNSEWTYRSKGSKTDVRGSLRWWNWVRWRRVHALEFQWVTNALKAPKIHLRDGSYEEVKEHKWSK